MQHFFLILSLLFLVLTPQASAQNQQASVVLGRVGTSSGSPGHINQPIPINTNRIQLQASFSKGVPQFNSSNISCSQCTVTNFKPNNQNRIFTFFVNIPEKFSNQNAIISIRRTKFSIESNTVTIRHDNVNPTAVIKHSIVNPINASADLDIAFSEDVIDFDKSDLVIENGSVEQILGSGRNYKVSVVGRSNGPVKAALASGAVKDLAGNLSSASNQIQFDFDRERPQVQLISVSPTNIRGDIIIDALFSEAVTGFDGLDLVVTNASVVTMTGSGKKYQFSLRPKSAGQVSVLVPGEKAADGAGNFNILSNKLEFNFDNMSPTAELRAVSRLQTNGEMNVELLFSEDVVGLDVSDFELKNGILRRLSGAGRNYNLLIAGINPGEVTVLLPSDRLNDLAGNGNRVSNQVRFVFDAVPPSVELAFLRNPQSAVSGVVEVRARFSEEVSGFEPGDLEITNGSIAGNFTIQGSDYIFLVVANSDGPVTIRLPSNKVQDLSGNSMLNSSNTIRFDSDRTAPTVELSYRAAPGSTKTLSQMISRNGSARDVQAIRVNSATIEINASFSEDVLGFTPSSFWIKNGTIKDLSGSGRNYRILISPVAAGFVEVGLTPAVAFKDLAGNVGEPAGFTHYFRFDHDGERASATLTSSAPKSTSGRIPVSVEFSEAVEGFSAASVRLSQGRVEDFVGSIKSFKFAVVPTHVGSVEISLEDMQIRDLFGNIGLRNSNKLSFLFDDQKPSVELKADVPKRINTTVKVEAFFGEDVIGFDAADLFVKNGTVSQFVGTGRSYSFLLTPSSRGSVSVSVSAGAVKDAAGNQNEASLPLGFEFDDSSLTAELSSNQGSDTEGPVDVKVRFSKMTKGFSETSIVLTQGQIKDFRFDGIDANFFVVPSGVGQLKIEINENGISDSFGNLGLKMRNVLTFNVIERNTSEILNENGKLIIRIKGQGNQVSIWRDADNYFVQGKNLPRQKVEASKVKEISVEGSDHADQEFNVLAGGAPVVTHPLSVNAFIERVVLAGPLLVTGDLNIESASIIIASDIATTGRQIYGGEVQVSGDREIRSDRGDVIFKGHVRASNFIFYDPDSVPAKTSIHNFHPLIQVERK